MRAVAAAIAALALSGCAEIFDSNAALESYEPFALVRDRGAYLTDLNTCRAKTRDWHHRLSARSIAMQGARGGASNAAGAALNPLVPALGALGSATDETLRGLGATSAEKIIILSKCMRALGQRSGAYDVIDPNS